MLASPRILTLAAIIGVLGSGAAAVSLVAPDSGQAGRAGMPGSGRLPANSVRAAPAQAELHDASARLARAKAARRGLRLLTEAVAACADLSYRGVQVVSWAGPRQTDVAVVTVWHRPGQAALVQEPGAPAVPHVEAAPGTSGNADEVLAEEPASLLELSPPLLGLLRANYQVAYAGPGIASGRTADVLAIRRRGGAMAARIWLDRATKLPLRRVLFDSRARVVSVDVFVHLRLGPRSLGHMPSPAAQPWSGQLGLRRVASMRARGWPIPTALPGGLRLFSASEQAGRAGSPGPVVGLSYSDGLSVVSLFIQRGALPRVVPGWQPVILHGIRVYAADPEGRSLTWSAGGFVLTVIADAPPATVAAVVSSLPHARPGGFWGRLGRGFRRLAALFNPFR
jgi:hypothetical protein